MFRSTKEQPLKSDQPHEEGTLVTEFPDVGTLDRWKILKHVKTHNSFSKKVQKWHEKNPPFTGFFRLFPGIFRLFPVLKFPFFFSHACHVMDFGMLKVSH